MNIQFDIPVEVTESQYHKVMRECGGIVAGQKREGKFYIKVWLMKYKDYVKEILNK